MNEFGPKYKEEETLGIIDDVLKAMMKRGDRWGESGSFHLGGGDAKDQWDRIHVVLSMLADVELNRVQERHSLCIVSSTNGQILNEETKALSSSEAQPKYDANGSSK